MMMENHHLKEIFLYTANQVKIAHQKKPTQIMTVLDPNLEPMVYPLLYPYGDQSWGIDIPLKKRPQDLYTLANQSYNPRVRVTRMQYYGYRLSIREDFNPFLNAGRLTQQYIVDAYVKTEDKRLNYIRQNQPKKYTGLMDNLLNEANEACLSPRKMYILSALFARSPRNMQQNYQDAMAIVRKYGKPDLFITMTCNPKWEEIVHNLQHGQTVDGQPHLVARVFHLKLKALIDDISKKHIFRVPKAIVYMIEFQRGAEKNIGRMYSVNLTSDKERYCLSLLLLHVAGAVSFEDLRTVHGNVYFYFPRGCKSKRTY
ncbi:uncharacterized protein LOC122931877 [Bufo gargarizans]|uniref:uncharacterized protein LOC122931877 n=1 Tax=Bufo gargarizans TaxID=30331 RepID=UPI001CF17FA2|nr:uncharacterized protein LOC122931877 [Bufo gargarizans]